MPARPQRCEPPAPLTSTADDTVIPFLEERWEKAKEARVRHAVTLAPARHRQPAAGKRLVAALLNSDPIGEQVDTIRDLRYVNDRRCSAIWPRSWKTPAPARTSASPTGRITSAPATWPRTSPTACWIAAGEKRAVFTGPRS